MSWGVEASIPWVSLTAANLERQGYLEDLPSAVPVPHVPPRPCLCLSSAFALLFVPRVMERKVFQGRPAVKGIQEIG